MADGLKDYTSPFGGLPLSPTKNTGILAPIQVVTIDQEIAVLREKADFVFQSTREKPQITNLKTQEPRLRLKPEIPRLTKRR